MSDDNLENSANCGMPDDAVVETCEGCEACEWPQAVAWEQWVMGGSALLFLLSG